MPESEEEYLTRTFGVDSFYSACVQKDGMVYISKIAWVKGKKSSVDWNNVIAMWQELNKQGKN